MEAARRKRFKRQLDSTIIHFDFDCFYASVFEHETPLLKTVPLAVQQKQIVVTCNYEARRRGLYKLQLISEAKKVCPDVVIVLGEDLTRFRDASKDLYAFLRSFSWNLRCERLGFDEVFMDVSDMVDYNVSIVNASDPGNSFFCLARNDPTSGFSFDASRVAGLTCPEVSIDSLDITALDPLQLRLHLASHLAQYLRQALETEKGYTASVGISTNKLLAKLVGNVHKPNNQTTLLSPYVPLDGDETDNVTSFIDDHELGKIPGIGFKIAQNIRGHVLQRSADFDAGLVYGGTKENVRVGDVRKYPGMGPEILERLLGGSGAPQGIGLRVWDLLNGCDAMEVGRAREVPTQISIEDSYVRLDTLDEVVKELRMLATKLVKRMHTDLLEDDEDVEQQPQDVALNVPTTSKRWLAHPRTLRLSTRPRPPRNPDGSRNRSFARISKSAPMPGFVFSLKDGVEEIVDRLLNEALIPLFRRLHPEKSGWNLSLVNVAATNMADAASEKGGVGRDIAKMFRRQDDVLKQWKVEEREETVEDQDAIGENQEAIYTDRQEIERWTYLNKPVPSLGRTGSEDAPTSSQAEDTAVVDRWESEDEDMVEADTYHCNICGAVMPLFAMGAHERWHA